MSEEFLGIPDLEVIADPASQGLSSLNVGQEFGQPLIPVPQFERPEAFRDFVSQNRLFGNPDSNPLGLPDFAIPNDVLIEQSRFLRDNPEFGQGRTPIIDPVTGEPVGLVPFAPIIPPDLFNEDNFESQVNTALANQEFQEVPRTRSEIEEGLRALQQEAAASPSSPLLSPFTQQPSDVIFGGEDSSDFLIGGGGSDFGRTPTIGLSSDFDAINRRIQNEVRGERPPQPQEIIRKEAPREKAPTPSLLQQIMQQFFRNIFPTSQKKDEQAGLPSLFISEAMAGELPKRIPTELLAKRTPIGLTGITTSYPAAQEAIQNLTRGRPVSRRENLTPQEQARARRIEEGKQATAEIRQAVGPEIYDKEQQLKLKNQAAIERFLRNNRYPKKKGGQVLKGRAMRSTNYNHQKFI